MSARRWPGPDVDGGVSFVLAAHVSAGEQGRALPGRLALGLFDAWCPEALARGLVRATVAQVSVALGGSLSEDAAAGRARVVRALRERRVLLLRGESGGARTAGAAPATREEVAAPTSTEREVKTWVTIQLVDEDDPPRPVPFARYRIRLPDQSVREGRLNADGIAHYAGIDPGECEVSFPDLDSRAWHRAG